MGTPFPDLGYLRGEVFSFFHFLFDLSDSYILHLSRGVMLKLILVLCLFGITVLAKPSRLQAKTDVRRMQNVKWDDGNCTDPVTGRKFEVWWSTYKLQYVCVKGVGYSCREVVVGATFQDPWGGTKQGHCYRTCPVNYRPGWDSYDWKTSKVKCDYTLNYKDPKRHLQCVGESEKTCRDYPSDEEEHDYY